MAIIDDFIYEYTRFINNLKAINSCIDATGRYHDNLGRFTSKIGWFVDGVLNNNLSPLENAIKVGDLSENVISYLEKIGITIGRSDIQLTYGKVEHITRENKKEAQKVSDEQLKRVIDIIAENNVFYDKEKKNILYVSKLPPDEIKLNRDWVKVPINLNDEKRGNIVATMSIIPSTTITDSPQIYKKID